MPTAAATGAARAVGSTAGRLLERLVARMPRRTCRVLGKPRTPKGKGTEGAESSESAGGSLNWMGSGRPQNSDHSAGKEAGGTDGHR